MNSGGYGDLIYSLAVLPYLGKGEYKLAMNNLADCARSYGYDVSERTMGKMHREYFQQKHYDFLAPLLEVQPFITKVSQWHKGDEPVTYNLDDFRGTLFKRFEGNYLEAFFITHNIPYTQEMVHGTNWLTVPNPIRVAETIIARTTRYRSPTGNKTHAEYATVNGFDKKAVFIGTDEEHQDYEKVTGLKIKRYVVKDALEYAQVIAGADRLVSNQTFAFSLAMGLGECAFLEVQQTKPLEFNECYFARKNCYYF